MTQKNPQKQSEDDQAWRFMIAVFPDIADEIGRKLHRNYRDSLWPSLEEMGMERFTDEEFDRFIDVVRQRWETIKSG